MWRSNRTRMSFVPKEGMQVIAGNVSVYERDCVPGIRHIHEPAGLGALYARFEELKRKLKRKGCLRLNASVPCPCFPGK